ncbi:hypothetical protein DM02DRAFT_723869 [Periconia macrospinosa]|uniref:RING-type E3 ubiquitin transferase n=1 Tax=Periconia macrospinosa TaxID=97972 RepID=A0A2V1E947_9PLEO|nr:hypothetical protein DM02DRAFT_723869 [Periconia macrospinosa]
MARLHMYIAGSAVLAKVVLLRAYYERPNFYSAAVYISQSTGSLMFLINLALIVLAGFGYGLQRLFYGTLRPIETEQLYDKAWFAISETLLAMTIFRDDIGIGFFAMFVCLLSGKLWQWIGEGRVEFLEQQPPANPKLFHARLMSSLLLSVAFDIFMMDYCISSILSNPKAGVMIMFGFEYVLLTIASVSTILRYVFSLVELFITHRQQKAREEAIRVAREAREQQARQRAETADGEDGESQNVEEEDEDDDDGDVPGWEEKGRWMFYLDLATDFIKSVLYIGFFFILIAISGIPIHIMRDLFMTCRSFYNRVHDFIQYRNATRDMNARYPDATAEELERENTCIVCREEMRLWVPPGAAGAQPGRRIDERQRPKKLPCGHILHFSCLRSWLERQQVCPTCRRSVLSQPTTQANPHNAGQQNQPNAGGGQGILGGGLDNLPAAGQPGQPGPAAQPAPGAQGNRPVGNLRVFNLGPVRIALGNLRVPPNPPGNANNINNNNNAIANLAQQLAQNQYPNLQQQEQGLPPPQIHVPVIPGAVGQHPSDIQMDILRIQQNIIESMRQLSVQHTQLQHFHSLLAELNRLQQTSGIPGTNALEVPPVASLNPTLPTIGHVSPQAYSPNGPVLRHGDAGLPDGVVLPEGWTLRPMVATSQPGPIATGSSAAAGLQATPRSLDSSWSFGNAGGDTETEGSSTAVAGSSSTEDGTLTRRTVTVEDADDDGQ